MLADTWPVRFPLQSTATLWLALGEGRRAGEKATQDVTVIQSTKGLGVRK